MAPAQCLKASFSRRVLVPRRWPVHSDWGRSQTLAQDLACRSKQNLVEIGSVTRHRFIFRGCGRRAGRRVDLVGQTEVDSLPAT